MKLWEFESARDRDNTLVALLVFALFLTILLLFHDNLSNDAIIAIVSGTIGWIGAIVNFHYANKAHGNGGTS